MDPKPSFQVWQKENMENWDLFLSDVSKSLIMAILYNSKYVHKKGCPKKKKW